MPDAVLGLVVVEDAGRELVGTGVAAVGAGDSVDMLAGVGAVGAGSFKQFSQMGIALPLAESFESLRRREAPSAEVPKKGIHQTSVAQSIVRLSPCLQASVQHWQLPVCHLREGLCPTD